LNKELERNAGTQFDPEVVRVLVEEVRRKPPTLEWQDLVPALRNAGSILGHDALSLIDNLTLLYSRRYFHESTYAEAQRAEARGRTFSVVLIELTGIAELNWREGYAAGDEAMRTAARTVQHAASRHGGTACRQGGHRLSLILPDADERSAGLLADELLVSLRDEPSVRVAAASWRPGDDGEAVIVRARLDDRPMP
jgi:diguanylate cyclase (GGDEF)-like protein